MPRSNREKTAKTRENIIEAAYQLFIGQGYHATSMRGIAAQAGVTVGALYHHFGDKEQIWQEVLVERHPYRDVLPLIQQIQGETIADVLRQAAHIMVRELQKRPELINLMLIEIVEHNMTHAPALAETIMPQLAGLQHLFLEKRGKLRDIAYPVIFRSFLGLFFSFYVTGILMSKVTYLGQNEDTLDQFIDLYLHGILEEQV